ncbi:MAG TPA: DUF4476 domain-containing protein [Myxococcales bacterium]|jgi:hypothetical protein|nr:DUF4476 domain-containing protein [Myxococcales bacterium]
MKRILLAILLVAACAAPQVVPPEKPTEAEPAPPEKPEVQRPPPPTPPVIIVEDGMRLEYRAHGRTVIEITEPEGMQVQAFDGPALVAADTVPVAFDALPDHYYRMVFQLPSGAVREKKLQARAGDLLTVRVMESKGPQAMSEKDFRTLRAALERESGDTGKLAVLRTAAANAFFTTAQAGQLIDRLVYRDDKLAAVPILKDRILDKQNAWQLYQHFTYREDKMKVQEILEH